VNISKVIKLIRKEIAMCLQRISNCLHFKLLTNCYL